jgi:hypothetical protein
VPTFTAGDASLYYEEHGEGDPLVLAQGCTATGNLGADGSRPTYDGYPALRLATESLGAVLRDSGEDHIA